MSLGSNGVDHVRSLPKIPMQFRCTNFALVAPVQPISHRVSCRNKTIQNAPKHYKTHRFMSLASNGVHRVSCSNETLPNAPKHYKMLQNMCLVPMRWIECGICEKFWCDFMAQTCALIAPVPPVLHRVSCSNETMTNAPKHYENAPKDEFTVQWGGSRAFVAKNSDASSWHGLLH